jgi:hypothetical protein
MLEDYPAEQETGAEVLLRQHLCLSMSWFPYLFHDRAGTALYFGDHVTDKGFMCFFSTFPPLTLSVPDGFTMSKKNPKFEFGLQCFGGQSILDSEIPSA